MYIYIYGGSALRSSVIISTGQMYIHFSNVLVAHVAHEAIYNIKYLLYIYVYIYTRVYIVCENISRDIIDIRNILRHMKLHGLIYPTLLEGIIVQTKLKKI